MSHLRILFFGFAWLLAFAGCVTETLDNTPPVPTPSTSQMGADFDSKSVTTIHGRAIWHGDVPKAEEQVTRRIAFNHRMHLHPARWTTRHVPKVDAASNGIENAVVYLRTIDSRRAKPWDHEPVRIEIDDHRLAIHQGKRESGVGFVRLGETLDIVNIDTKYHNLRAGGAAFFGLPMFKPDVVHQKTFTQAGLVDLRCTAGYYWLHAHLFVVEHPYYVQTDSTGRFELSKVPPGEYDAVCWLPSWHVEREERCPATGIIARIAWKPPVEHVQRIRVAAGESVTVDFRWDVVQFGK